jgi:endonuclease/exonuclease/phosphatase family metal-dependent hydrolase
MQAHEGMTAHMDWITARDTMVLGDFNKNASFRAGRWDALQRLLEGAGLVSVYHETTGEPFGKETQRTYFHRRKDDASAQHIDYCFVPARWVERITHFQVGTPGEWCQAKMSDHVPLTVDVDI